MATEQFNITSLFQPSGGATTIKRKDSGISSQMSNFSFGEKSSSPASKPVTLTFTPSTGSTCISLYPRTKTFTFFSSLSSTACLATDESDQSWRISAVPPSPDSEIRRFNFEKVEEEGEVVREAYRRCSVVVPPTTSAAGHTRRQSSHDFGRRLSVGHYSSGWSGFKLPYSPAKA